MRLIRYPQFLKTSPSLFGFELLDLFIFGFALNILSQFKIHPLISITICLGIVGVKKILKKYIDFTSWRYTYSRPDTYKWVDEIERLKETKR